MVTWWMWMVAGFFMLAAEMFAPGMFLLFFGVGAVFMGFFQLLFPGVPLWIEVLIFLGVSTLWLAVFRQRLVRYVEKRNPPKPVDEIAGEMAVALEDIGPQQLGKAELRGTAWNALNLGVRPIRKSEQCRVSKVEGLTLHVSGV